MVLGEGCSPSVYPEPTSVFPVATTITPQITAIFNSVIVKNNSTVTKTQCSIKKKRLPMRDPRILTERSVFKLRPIILKLSKWLLWWINLPTYCYVPSIGLLHSCISQVKVAIGGVRTYNVMYAMWPYVQYLYHRSRLDACAMRALLRRCAHNLIRGLSSKYSYCECKRMINSTFQLGVFFLLTGRS